MLRTPALIRIGNLTARDIAKAAQKQIGRHRHRPRLRIELKRAAGKLIQVKRRPGEIGAAQLVEHQVRKKSEHRTESQINAKRYIRAVIKNENRQPGDDHGRDAVKDAAMHRDALKYLR